MNVFRRSVCLAVWLGLLWLPLVTAQEPTPSSAPVIKILSFKISKDYYPMLDGKPSMMSADKGELPMTEAEISARNNASTNRRNRSSSSVLTEEKRSRGRLHSTIQILDRAESVNLTVLNTSPKTIKAITWDFAFPRMEEGKLLLRHEVSNQISIKPGGKKGLKQPLPAGAARCKVLRANESSDQSAQTAESLCGRGIHDPAQLPEKQAPVTIKRIEYTDGSVWQNPATPLSQPTTTTSVKEDL